MPLGPVSSGSGRAVAHRRTFLPRAEARVPLRVHATSVSALPVHRHPACPPAWPLWIMLLWPLACGYLFRIPISVVLDKRPEVQLLGCNAVLR